MEPVLVHARVATGCRGTCPAIHVHGCQAVVGEGILGVQLVAIAVPGRAFYGRLTGRALPAI